MRNSASRWTIGMALAPAVVAMAGFLVMFLDRLISVPDSMLNIGLYAMLAAMFGGIVLTPGIACTVAAAPLVRTGHRLGRRTATIGLTLLAVGDTAIIYGLLDWAHNSVDSRDPQFFNRPTLTEAAIAATFFAAMILGDFYAMRKVLQIDAAPPAGVATLVRD